MLARLWYCGVLTSFAYGCQSTRLPSSSPTLAGATATPAQAEKKAFAPQKDEAKATSPTGETTPAAPTKNTRAQESVPVDTRTAASIQKVLTDTRARLRHCYDEALKTNPGIAGDLVVGFIIRADGTVKGQTINWSESDIHVPELETCALEQVSSFVFPPSSRGMESRVNYPYNFNPSR